jgi:hypothetical protein
VPAIIEEFIQLMYTQMTETAFQEYCNERTFNRCSHKESQKQYEERMDQALAVLDNALTFTAKQN